MPNWTNKKNQFIFNLTRGEYFVTDIETDEVHCQFENCIYLLTCAHCGMEYVGERIVPLNLQNDRITRPKVL